MPDHLGIGDKGYTKRLKRTASDFGFERSFAKAAKSLKEHYGFSLPVSGVADTTLVHARKIAEHLDQRDRTMCLPAKGVGTIIAEADGSFVPIVSTQGKASDKRRNRQINYQEARLCACQAKGRVDCFYEATFQEVDQVGKLWAECAKTAGRGLNTQIHSLGDGATWIQKQAQNYLQPKRYLVDFYHTCEYLANAKEACATNSRWMNTQKNRLKTNHPQKVLKTLKPYIEAESIDDTQAPVRTAHRYIQNRLDQLDYKGFWAEKLPIGSGLIESGHKHVLQVRLKITGAAWSLENAENIAKARILRANGQWGTYWAK